MYCFGDFKSKCNLSNKLFFDPNSTIVELMLNHTRTFEYLADIELGEGRLRPRPEGYLGRRERYLSSSFDIVKISLWLFCRNTTSHPKYPSASTRGIWGDLFYFRPNTSLFSNVLVRFHIRVIISDIFILQTEDLFYIKTKLHFNKCVID